MTKASLPPEQRSAFWANVAGAAVGLPAFIACELALYNRDHGWLVILLFGAVVVALYVVHFVRVDRQWQKVVASSH